MLITAFLCLIVEARAAASSQLNIIFIMADDHNQAAMSCYGSETIRTPNLDRLAAQGMRFNHMTATVSLCGPSRAVLLTGKYSHRNGFTKNGNSFDGAQQTFPKLLQQAGYETAIVGKWHLRSQPTGFDYYNIMPGQGQFYDGRLKEIGQPWKDGSGGGVARSGYMTDVITDVSIEWIKNRDRNRPFCLMVHHKAPHSPHDPASRHKDLFKDIDLPVPDTLLDDYEGRVPRDIASKIKSSRMLVCRYPQYREDVAKAAQMGRVEGTHYMYQIFMKGYLRLVTALDENIGRLLDHLDESGLSDNTVVIYTSDNGFFNGEHGFFNKMWMYEPSLHLPLLVRWPGKVESGSLNDDLVSMLDIAPTLLDVVGARIPSDLQGRSFLPLLEGKTPTDWRGSVYYHYYEQFQVPEHFGIRTRNAKLIRYPALDRWELFDLRSDPDEMVNLYGRKDYDSLTSDLKKHLIDLGRGYGDNIEF